jgi:hypothetical protein
VWGRDITTQALVVIQAVLPGFEWKVIFLRAHRLESDRKDKASWISCEFATAEQAIWFVNAFMHRAKSPI